MREQGRRGSEHDHKRDNHEREHLLIRGLRRSRSLASGAHGLGDEPRRLEARRALALVEHAGGDRQFRDRGGPSPRAVYALN